MKEVLREEPRIRKGDRPRDNEMSSVPIHKERREGEEIKPIPLLSLRITHDQRPD